MLVVSGDSIASQGTTSKEGVKFRPLLPITPLKLVIALLHCEMGLVNKSISFYLQWAFMNVLMMESPEEDEIRFNLQTAEDDLRRAVEVQASAREQYGHRPTTEPGKTIVAEATEHKKEAEAYRAESNKKKFKDLASKLKRREGSFYFEMELILKDLEVVRNYYHGGDFNGVACIRILQEAWSLFDRLLVKLIDLRDPGKLSIDEIQQFHMRMKNLYRLLDNIFSQVPGVEKGLLPSDEDVQVLIVNFQAAKAQWIELGITIYQPKWHYIFDGLLPHQYATFGGLADKSYQTLEKLHQLWEMIRSCNARITSFEARCQSEMKQFRQGKHNLLRKELQDQKDSLPHHSPESERHTKFLERQSEKLEKRWNTEQQHPKATITWQKRNLHYYHKFENIILETVM